MKYSRSYAITNQSGMGTLSKRLNDLISEITYIINKHGFRLNVSVFIDDVKIARVENDLISYYDALVLMSFNIDKVAYEQVVDLINET